MLPTTDASPTSRLSQCGPATCCASSLCLWDRGVVRRVTVIRRHVTDLRQKEKRVVNAILKYGLTKYRAGEINREDLGL